MASSKSTSNQRSKPESEEDMTGFLANPGVAMFGPEVIMTWLLAAWLRYGLPIVSVGSGHGFIEGQIERSEANPKIICVDPDPLSYCKDGPQVIYRQPNYPYVRDLLKAQSSIVNNNILFINWAWPNLRYDYDAILELKPKAIISLYATDDFFDPQIEGGSAGSYHFHRWLEVQEQYQSVAWARVKPIQEINVLLRWWERIDGRIPRPLNIPHEYPCLSEYSSDNFQNQNKDIQEIIIKMRALFFRTTKTVMTAFVTKN